MTETNLNALKVLKAIQAEMPHLEVVVWDLEPFMKGFHNWRKNMIFVECEDIAIDELRKILYHKFKSITFFSGTKRIRVWDGHQEPTSASIVILSRKEFKDTVEDKETGAHIPSLEERVIDLLAYSLREDIPMTVAESANAIAYVLSRNMASITKMHRYATRKYVDWLFKIIISQMAKRGEIGGVDPRFTKAGEQYLSAIKGVENRE